jgi:iron complex outermembrane receptor protein
VRLAWQPGPDHLFWGAVSRAVRAPARLDHDIRLPGAGPPFFIVGGSDFVSEVANVFELGYRGQLEGRLNFSATAFRYEWDRLRSGELPPATVQNRIEGNTYGLELWGTLQATKAWRLSAGLTTLTERLHVEQGSTDPTGPSALANDPHYQWQLRSSFDLATDQDLDVSLRRVGRLPEPVVPAYYSLDARYAWRPRKNLELSATAQNLLDPGHPEFNALPGRSEIERAIFLRATWRL